MAGLETVQPGNPTCCLQIWVRSAISVFRMATVLLDLRELRAQLARRGMMQWQLAAALGVSASALSSYLHGHAPAPPDLLRRIASVLAIDEALIATAHPAAG